MTLSRGPSPNVTYRKGRRVRGESRVTILRIEECLEIRNAPGYRKGLDRLSPNVRN